MLVSPLAQGSVLSLEPTGRRIARSNIAQQMFRSAYYNLRTAGQSINEAALTVAEIVRLYVPGFTPIQT